MVGTQLKSLRLKKGYTVAQLCSEMGLNPSSYVKYEREEREIGINTLSKFADFYGVTTDYLLGRTETNDKSNSDLIDTLINRYNLDPLEQKILREYVALPDHARENVMDFLKRTVAAKENKENGGV